MRIETSCAIELVQQSEGGGFRLISSAGSIHAAALVVASGGLSIPSMGASGFGYDIARQFEKFIQSPPVKELFKKYGFAIPNE